MDIAAMSMMLSQANIQQEASMSVMKIAMDTATDNSEMLNKVMEQSVNPHIGGNIDFKL